MKNNTVLSRNPEFVLEKIESDFQLRFTPQDTAVFINNTAAILWELCDGNRSIEDIKALLKEAYPEATESIDSDIDSTVDHLAGHGALLKE